MSAHHGVEDLAHSATNRWRRLRGFRTLRDEVNAAGGIKACNKLTRSSSRATITRSQTVRVQELYYARLITQDKARSCSVRCRPASTPWRRSSPEENGKLMLSTAANRRSSG